MPNRPFLRALLLSLLVCAPACADPLSWSSASAYAIHFLPSGFASSGINNAGQVVGTYGGAAAIYNAGGSITSLAGVAPNSAGLALNDRGDIAGTLHSSGGGAFAWIGGVLVPVYASMPPSYEESSAAGINNAGTVVGLASPYLGEARYGFVYENGSVRIIPTLGGDWSTAEAVNASGAVVGAVTLSTGTVINPDYHPYIDRGGVMQDLGTLGGRHGGAYDINDAGLVAGWAENATGEARPFLFSDGVMVDLGSLGGNWGYARGLNNAGVVVGMSDLIAGEGVDERAFLYHDGTLLDLNTLVTGAAGWEIVDATDINDAGQILGRACHQGTCADVLLDLVPAVPEPGAWALLLAGLALLGGARSRPCRNARRPC